MAFRSPINRIDQRIEAMSKCIAHRGPDGDGVFAGHGVVLAHRRLSILELTDAGAQPMVSRDGHTVVAFNGEIFNFRELRAELINRGCRFRGGSDTEVILAAYGEWGLHGLERLEGMFAIALWDASKSMLVLMRDRLGIKPMFYSLLPDSVVFGSEIKAVLASGLVSERIDQQALSEYLWFGNAYQDRTIYRGVRALEPGRRLIWDGSGCRVEKWWEIEQWLETSEAKGVRTNPVEAVRESIDAAVRRQVLADVPVGLLLSGGLDSSSVASSAATSPDARAIRSFTAYFGDFGNVDERQKARQVADALGLRNETVEIGPLDIEAIVRKLVGAHDEPFADAANVPLYAIARTIAKEVKVILQGDGGDELFGGYRRHLLIQYRAAWQCVPSVVLGENVFRIHPLLRRLGRIAVALKSTDPAMLMGLLLTTDTQHRGTIQYFNVDMVRQLRSCSDPFLAYRHAASRFVGHDPLTMMLLTDMTVQLPSQFLTKVDRSTMAAGVEARVPLLDEVVCRTALSLPVMLKVRGLKKKVALRAALRGRIPNEVLDAPKSGFGVPYKKWLTGPLWNCAEQALLASEFIERFKVDKKRLIADMQIARGRGNYDGYQLWKLMQLALWARDRPNAFI